MSILKGDYIGFTFNSIHSSDLNIIRVSNGSRYEKNLLPTFQDKTAIIDGGIGTFYWETNYTQKVFTIPIAFENVTEIQLRRLEEKMLGQQNFGKLIFDENPYKYYMVKPSGESKINYVPFEKKTVKNGVTTISRYYNGEGTLNFIAYYPFAKSRYKFLDEYTNTSIPEWNKNGTDGFYNNIAEWSAASRLAKSRVTSEVTYDTAPIKDYNNISFVNRIDLYNAGDYETDFCLLVKLGGLGGNALKISLNADSIYNSEGSFELLRTPRSLTLSGINSGLTPVTDEYVLINTKTNLIEGVKFTSSTVMEKTGKIYNDHIIAGDFFKIIKGRSYLTSTSTIMASIEYDYIYI